MDVFMVYLFVATATPLFLWNDSRKLALWQTPFIALLWTYVVLYMTNDSLSLFVHSFFITVFIANVVFAHYAAYIVWGRPYLAKRKMEKAKY
jgi:hypothetical protein